MRRPSVLCVDDDSLSRAIVAKKISTLADVVEAEDGFDALSHLQSESFDLAIVDLEMPNFSGIELIGAIREHPLLRQLPVIVLTGDESRKGLEGALAAGATSFLQKPLNWRIFGDHIRHVLELAYRSGHLAMHDTLTELPNRALLNERLEHAIATLRPGALVAVHALDLDKFKQVNDTLGHSMGDKLLANVSERLRSLVRQVDTVSRMGGDEFAIVQVGIERASDAEKLAQRIVREISHPFVIDGQEISIGTTIGISLGPDDGATPERLLQSADLALYEAKGAGRGTFQRFNASMGSQQQARRTLERDLRKALAADEFEMYYQPIVNLLDNRISGFEALIRWHHPEKGMVRPDTFVPLAEETGLIVPLSAWVLRQACHAATEWPEEMKVAVNISAVHLRKPGLTPLVQNILRESGLDAGRLELEITETAALLNNDATLLVLHQLRELGVRIVSDDFGTGYSALAHVQSFTFDKIKIDRTFVKDSANDASSLNIVRAIANLAKGLGISSTAEGIEDMNQLATIIAEGCTEVQGYLLGHPMPVREIPQFLSARRKQQKAQQVVATA